MTGAQRKQRKQRRESEAPGSTLAWFVELEMARERRDVEAMRRAKAELRRLGVDVLHLDDRVAAGAGGSE